MIQTLKSFGCRLPPRQLSWALVNQHYLVREKSLEDLMKPVVVHIMTDMYKRYYFEIIDTIVGEIERRFESPSFSLYTKMESLLQSAAEGKEISDTLLKEVVDHFVDDLELLELRTELSLLKNVMASMEFTYPNLKTKVNEYQAILPQLMKLLQLLLVIPATSATSERSFSSLRLVKTFLRTTVNQERLNYLMMIYIHKERPIDLKGAMKEFIQRNTERKQTFGVCI